MNKQYSSTDEHHILTQGSHRVAIDRVSTKRINKLDKELLDAKLEEVLELRDTEPKHRCHKES